MADTTNKFMGADIPDSVTPKKSKVVKITKAKPRAVRSKTKKPKLPSIASFVKKRNELTKKF